MCAVDRSSHTHTHAEAYVVYVDCMWMSVCVRKHVFAVVAARVRHAEIYERGNKANSARCSAGHEWNSLRWESTSGNLTTASMVKRAVVLCGKVARKSQEISFIIWNLLEIETYLYNYYVFMYILVKDVGAFESSLTLGLTTINRQAVWVACDCIYAGV